MDTKNGHSCLIKDSKDPFLPPRWSPQNRKLQSRTERQAAGSQTVKERREEQQTHSAVSRSLATSPRH